MIDIARLREDPEAVRENIKKKFQDHKLPLVDEALELDKQYRAAITRASELRSMRNKLSKEIGQFMREGKKEEAAENKKKVGEMAEELKSLEEVEKESGDKLREVMMKIPNFLDPTVPIGKDDSENVEITKYGDPVVPDYEVPYHTDIMESFDGIDLDAAGRVAGNASIGKLFGKAMLAGMMIGMGAAASSVAAHSVANVGLARLTAAVVFPVGLMMVILYCWSMAAQRRNSYMVV